MSAQPRLLILAGLPGTGKSSIAAIVSRRTGAFWLRIDEIETALLREDPGLDLGPRGYLVAAALARSNLGLGHDVIVDCVNPWPLTREIFLDAARIAGAEAIGVEVTCSDPALHRARLEGRKADIPGHRLPSWNEVLARDWHPWPEARLHLDVAHTSLDAAALRVIALFAQDAASPQRSD